MNTPRTKASPTPNGKATAIPAMETEAESKMLEALKIIPPIKALTMYVFFHQGRYSYQYAEACENATG